MLQRTIIGMTLLLALTAPAAAKEPADDSPLKPHVADGSLKGYKLVWHDEFDGDRLDTAKWDYRTDSKALSTQKRENVSVRGGTLWLAAKKEDMHVEHYSDVYKNEKGEEVYEIKKALTHYSGAGIISKQAFKHGYYEARLKMPPGAGWHTSFWMMKHDLSGGTNPKATAQELDVCENDSDTLTNYGVNTHKWNPKPHVAMGNIYPTTPDLSADFHVYGCEFTPQLVKYFFDGRLIETLVVANFAHGDQNIWLATICRGGNKTKKPVDDARLPAAAQVDYVRFFEKD